MATLGIYAGASVAGMAILPSPVSLKTSLEQIWSEDTGRAQSGTNQAKMIGDSIAEKLTYEIQWGVLNGTDFATITSKLTRGFFYFGIGTSLAAAKSAAAKFYRGAITYETVQADAVYYKNVSVSVIQQ